MLPGAAVRRVHGGEAQVGVGDLLADGRTSGLEPSPGMAISRLTLRGVDESSSHGLLLSTVNGWRVAAAAWRMLRAGRSVGVDSEVGEQLHCSAASQVDGLAVGAELALAKHVQ